VGDDDAGDLIWTDFGPRELGGQPTAPGVRTIAEAGIDERPGVVLVDQEAAEGTGDFVSFADEMRQFLAFKELPPPTDAVFELLVQDVGGEVDTARLWSLVNFGDEPLLLAWPGVRLRLDPGGGCRLDAGFPPGVVPPVEEPTVLLAIRTGPAADDRPQDAEA